jgi:acetylornithine deacetylase/succinyl-diaminopimelate desuccinylase-like protein
MSLMLAEIERQPAALAGLDSSARDCRRKSRHERRLRVDDATPLARLQSKGLVGGYTGPGGKTILPHRAVAKLDLRLAPDMAAAEALAALKAHLAQKGFGATRSYVEYLFELSRQA